MPSEERRPDYIELVHTADAESDFRGSNSPDSDITLSPSRDLPPDIPGLTEADYAAADQETES